MTLPPVLTICNPYPELILLGEKPIENRTWRSDYRGPLLIHAAKSREWMTDDAFRRFPSLTWGAIVGMVDMVACPYIHKACWPVEVAHLRDNEHANGPWCHIYARPRRFLQPVECAGRRKLWTLPPDLHELVRQQIEAAS